QRIYAKYIILFQLQQRFQKGRIAGKLPALLLVSCFIFFLCSPGGEGSRSDLQIAVLLKHLKGREKRFSSGGCDKAYFLVHSRRIENTQESAHNNLVHSLGSQRQGIQAVQSLSRGDNGVMIRDLFVVYIACFNYIFVCTR